METGGVRVKPLEGKRNQAGFRGKKHAIYNIISESENQILSTYQIYDKFNSKYKRKGVTMNELANILSRNKSKFIKIGMVNNDYTDSSRSRKICQWGIKIE